MFPTIPLIQDADRRWWRYQQIDDNTALLTCSLGSFVGGHVCAFSLEDYQGYEEKREAKLFSESDAAARLHRHDGTERPTIATMEDRAASAQLRREMGYPDNDETAAIVRGALGREEKHLRMLNASERRAVLSEYRYRQANAASEPKPAEATLTLEEVDAQSLEYFGF